MFAFNVQGACRIRTSEKRLPHPRCWQMCGFSPVWVRMCTVKALRWMKLLLHPGVEQAYGRSLVCIL